MRGFFLLFLTVAGLPFGLSTELDLVLFSTETYEIKCQIPPPTEEMAIQEYHVCSIRAFNDVVHIDMGKKDFEMYAVVKDLWGNKKNTKTKVQIGGKHLNGFFGIDNNYQESLLPDAWRRLSLVQMPVPVNAEKEDNEDGETELDEPARSLVLMPVPVDENDEDGETEAYEPIPVAPPEEINFKRQYETRFRDCLVAGTSFQFLENQKLRCRGEKITGD